MRVAVDATPMLSLSAGLGPTGVGRWTAGAVGALAVARPDWQIDLVSFGRSIPVDLACLGDNVNTRVLPFSIHAHRKRLLMGVTRHITAHLSRADAMVGSGFITWPDVADALLPVIHDLAYIRYPRSVAPRNLLYLRMMLPRVVRSASTVIAVSETTKRDVVDVFGVTPAKVSVVPDGCDLQRFAGARPQSEILGLPGRYLLFVGTIEPRKNLRGLLHVHRDLRRERSDIPQLVLAGGVGWRARSTVRDIAAAVHTGDVIHLGYVPDEDLASVYAGAEALVYPSFYEGFGLPVLEAMASGCPVIASRRGGIPEVGGEAALYVDPEDPMDLKNAIVRLISDPSIRCRLGSAGRKRARGFTWESTGVSLAHAIERSV